MPFLFSTEISPFIHFSNIHQKVNIVKNLVRGCFDSGEITSIYILIEAHTGQSSKLHQAGAGADTANTSEHSSSAASPLPSEP